MENKMLKVIAISLIFLGQAIGKSLIEEHVGNRIIEQVKSMLMITLIWTIVILIISLLGIVFNMENIASWVVDFIFITYAIQGVMGILSVLRIVREYQDSFWSGIIINFFSITTVGILQAVLIPLAGLSAIYTLLIVTRGIFSISFGGGFFSWAWEGIINLFF